MKTVIEDERPNNAARGILQRWRGLAWLAVIAADVGLGAWGLGAALAPTNLLGPGGKAILPAGFEGFTGASWDQLAATAPSMAGYLILIFRMYGIYIVAFSLLAVLVAARPFRSGERWAWWTLLIGNSVAYISAMTYDRIVGAIGPFEWSEYLGIVLIYASLAVRRPRHPGLRPRDIDRANPDAPGQGDDSQEVASLAPNGLSREDPAERSA